MRALVVNCSAPHYNLGAHKLADWLAEQGHTVSYWDGDPGIAGTPADLVALSVIFSWHAPIAAQIALRYKTNAEVWCGGPGMFELGDWWRVETGLICHKGIDPRFDKQRGNYRMTFASRGCWVNCYFCIVPKMEGTRFTLDWDFQPAPILCDNNLSGLPPKFQEHIVKRYTETGTKLMDANSGFEPRSFTENTYHRWWDVLRGPWRFAFDTLDEEKWVRPMMSVLGMESPKRKQVYCLIGNEPFEQCYYRFRQIIAWGGEPYCQPVMPLDALSRDDITVAHDWTKQRLKDFARFANRHLWRSMKLSEYLPRLGESRPFAALT